jgi:hypothetical protein
MRGYDPRSEEVKVAAATCYVGNLGRQPVKNAAVLMGRLQTKRLIRRIPGRWIVMVNRTAGGRVLSKAGKTTPITLVKGVPVVGGFVGAGVDYGFTWAMAQAAKQAFPPRRRPTLTSRLSA